MRLIDQFIARYRRELDFYEQAARLVAEQLERRTQPSGIRAMVTSRAKNPKRLREKVERRGKDGRYATVEDIYEDIVDLAGARVSLYFPGQRDEVDKIVRSEFVLLGSPEEHPKPRTSTPNEYAKRFSGYGATHYHVRLREEALTDAQKRYVDARVEIQLASVLMLAWAEVEHDLVYKPAQGELSEDEYAILDELNGLVLAGEIALERLQRAGEVRTGERGYFSNHYDLASFLLDAARPILPGPPSDSTLGRVDVLFELLRSLELATPDRLAPYLNSLHSDTERRSISEQIVDQVLAADLSRYDTYTEARAALGLPSPRTSKPTELGPDAEYAQALGQFMTRWISFERFLEELARVLVPDDVHRPRVPTVRWLARFGILSEETLAEIDLLRRLRNSWVHGVERPDAQYVTEAVNRLQALLEELAQYDNEAVRTAMERAQRG